MMNDITEKYFFSLIKLAGISSSWHDSLLWRFEMYLNTFQKYVYKNHRSIYLIFCNKDPPKPINCHNDLNKDLEPCLNDVNSCKCCS